MSSAGRLLDRSPRNEHRLFALNIGEGGRRTLLPLDVFRFGQSNASGHAPICEAQLEQAMLSLFRAAIATDLDDTAQ